MSLFRLAASRTAHKFLHDRSERTERTERAERTSGIPSRPSEVPMATGALTGAAAGATAGSIAGIPGALLGAVVGGAMGAAAGRAFEVHASEESADSERLDRDIGVIGGDLGAADPNQPPPRVGAYSMASAGAGRASRPPAEGPMSAPERRED